MSGYIGTQPVPQATQTRQTFTATASQTSFATGGYQAGYLDVFLNGVKLVDGTDYTATNGSDVVLTTGAASGDTLEVVAYTAFEVLNQNFTGGVTVDNDAATVLTVDRATSDGTIIDVQKNGTSVGSIGTWSGTSYIGAGDTGLAFGFGNDDIRPFDPSTVSQRDAAVDLGESGTRFKDLYLSGGVYLGGTGSANKLDDVETGAWTPVLSGYTGVGYTSQTGKYTKIGNLVVAEFQIDIASIGTYSGNSRITGWPFPASNAINQNVGQVRIGLASASTINANSTSLYLGLYNNGSDAFLYSQTGGTYNGNVWQAGIIAATAVYRTNS